MLEMLDTQLKLKVNAGKLDMLMHLTNIKCDSGEDLDSYFGHIYVLAGELEANSLALPETYLLMVTLNGLPTDYNLVHTIIKSTNNIRITKSQSSQLQNAAHNYTSEWQQVTFQKVLYTPELTKNLLSTACIASKGCKLTIDMLRCTVFDQCGHTSLRAQAKGNMLVMPLQPSKPQH